MARAKTPAEGGAEAEGPGADDGAPGPMAAPAEAPVNLPPESAGEPLPPPVATASRGGIAGPAALVLGGALAAALGFALSRAVPSGWPVGATPAGEARIVALEGEVAALKAALSERVAPPDLSPLADGMAALKAQVTALEGVLAALPPPPPPFDLYPIAQRLDAMDERAAEEGRAVTAELAELDLRLAALESAPPPALSGDPEAAARLARDLAAMRADLAAQREAADKATAEVAAAAETARAALETAGAEAARLRAEAEAAVAAARRDAALGRLAAAVEGGAPFAAAAAELSAAGTALPEVLARQAGTGVPTLLSLQAGFPEAARAALEASLRADMGDTTMERIGTFLRTQTGVRSLEPREGADPDAVLSRAEAAVAAGDLAAALTEIAALPDAGTAALADWTARATARVDALSALAGLTVAP